MNHFLLLFLTLSVSAFAKPNILFMLTDDMGYSDISCYGAPDVKTPAIDSLARDGLRFTQMYSNGAECTPARTGFLTGRYPQRAGGMECAIGTGNVGRYDEAIALAKKHDLGLPASQARLAPGLKQAGYVNGVFGKWHLGYEPKFNPIEQGFDEFAGFLGGNVDYFAHVELSDLPVYLQGKELTKRKGYMTHLITDDAVAFIDQHKKSPFFLYVPFSVPHFPFQPPGDDPGDLHPKDLWTKGPRSDYVLMLQDLDKAVARILKALDTAGVSKNTVVVFASDHGAMKPGLNGPFRDYKGTLFEGGIRVPCIVRWPGKVNPGSESTQPATLMDLTASFLRIGGAKARDLDGIDILQHVQDDKPDMARTFFWRAKRGDRTWRAVRDGDLKYVRKVEGDTDQEWVFDLAKDPGETQALDLKSAKRLKKKLKRWESGVVPIR